MNNPLVSIVIPCYNHSKFIKETIHSVLSQSYTNWECIIVDDGSTDGSGEIAESFVTLDKRIRYFNQNNQGVAVARNNGINNAKGIYVLPLDSDDIIDKTYIEKAVDVYQKNSEVKLVYSQANMFGEINSSWTLPPYEYKELLLGNMIFNAALFKKEDFDATSGYNPAMKNGLEDWEFWIRFLELNDKVYRINETLFFYRVQSTSRNNSIDIQTLKELRRQLYIYNFDKYCMLFGEPLDVYAQEKLVNIQSKEIERLEEKLKERISYKLRMMIKWIGRSFKNK